MIASDPLQACLLDLLHELRETDIRLALGGGYGIFLKYDYVKRTRARTLIPSVPSARSTNDLDLLLRAELLANNACARLLAEGLRRLGYQSISSARHYQFVRTIEGFGGTREVKIDLLTGPRSAFEPYPWVKVDARRAHPHPSVELHARPTEEAVGFEDESLEVQVAGRRSNDTSAVGTVLLPQPFSYAAMKLHAYRDRRDDPRKDFGRHHALDLYSILAMATEPEWAAARRLSLRYQGSDAIRKASEIVRDDFSQPDQIGLLRIREHPLFDPNMDLTEFMAALAELFPSAFSDLKP